MRQNGYWLGSLQAMHLLGRDPRGILHRVERAESLTQENIHAALRKCFAIERHTDLDARIAEVAVMVARQPPSSAWARMIPG